MSIRVPANTSSGPSPDRPAGPETQTAAANLQRGRSTFWTPLAWLAGGVDPLAGILSARIGLFAGPRGAERWNTPRRRRRGLIIILGGIEGPSIFARAMAGGILRSGWRGAVVVFRWNAGIPLLRSFRNLIDSVHHERRAAELAEFIRAYRHSHGAARVGMLGQSGGCWIVVRALELLGTAEAIDRAALLAPAISPGYDPSRAAAACRGGLMSVGGPGDLFFLGLGTAALGTSDRRWTPAAGLVGWRTHPAGFIDARWRPSWARWGYLGNHISIVSPAFIERVIAPWLAGGGRT